MQVTDTPCLEDCFVKTPVTTLKVYQMGTNIHTTLNTILHGRKTIPHSDLDPVNNAEELTVLWVTWGLVAPKCQESEDNSGRTAFCQCSYCSMQTLLMEQLCIWKAQVDIWKAVCIYHSPPLHSYLSHRLLCALYSSSCAKFPSHVRRGVCSLKAGAVCLEQSWCPVYDCSVNKQPMVELREGNKFHVSHTPATLSEPLWRSIRMIRMPMWSTEWAGSLGKQQW